MGLTSYFRAHIQDYAEKAFPLTELLGRYKPEKLAWGAEQQAAFETLKKALISRPVLHPPDKNKDWIVMADASATTISGILLQEGDNPDDTPLVVSYAFRKLLPRERNYSIIECELLSIVFSLAKFRHFVYGRRITVKSDHRALLFLNSVVKTNPRLACWALQLQEYNIDLKFIRGKNQLADAFTRLED